MLLVVGVGSWGPVGLVVRMPYAEPSGWHAGKTLPMWRQCARVPKIIGVFILQCIQHHLFTKEDACIVTFALHFLRLNITAIWICIE